MSYITPKVTPHAIIRRTHRYIVIELVKDASFDGWSKSECDYVFYDKLKTAVISLIAKTPNGKFVCSGMGLYSQDTVLDGWEEVMKFVPAESKACERAFTGR